MTGSIGTITAESIADALQHAAAARATEVATLKVLVAAQANEIDTLRTAREQAEHLLKIETELCTEANRVREQAERELDTARATAEQQHARWVETDRQLEEALARVKELETALSNASTERVLAQLDLKEALSWETSANQEHEARVAAETALASARKLATKGLGLRPLREFAEEILAALTSHPAPVAAAGCTAYDAQSVFCAASDCTPCRGEEAPAAAAPAAPVDILHAYWKLCGAVAPGYALWSQLEQCRIRNGLDWRGYDPGVPPKEPGK